MPTKFFASCAVSLLVLFVSVPLADAQSCSSSSNIADESFPGTFRVHGATTQMHCSGRTVYVRVWITGHDYDCSGAENAAGECYDESASTNAGATAWAAGYGSAEGYSRHSYLEGGTTYNLPNRTINLVSADDPQDQVNCESLGGTWMGDFGKCSFPSSPIVIATNRNSAYKLTSESEGVMFDIDGDGVAEMISWTEKGTDVAFLAYDKDGDGAITSGKELFGNFTRSDSTNGFEALRRMSLETNGGVVRHSVSSLDPLFERLLLWTDVNHNGVSEPTELRPAQDVVSDIGLSYEKHERRDNHGNLYRYKGWVHVRTAAGRNKAADRAEDLVRRRQIYDVFFVRQR